MRNVDIYSESFY